MGAQNENHHEFDLSLSCPCFTDQVYIVVTFRVVFVGRGGGGDAQFKSSAGAPALWNVLVFSLSLLTEFRYNTLKCVTTIRYYSEVSFDVL